MVRRKSTSRKTKARPAARPAAARAEARKALQSTLDTVAGRLLRDRRLRPGSIVFRDPDDEHAAFALRASGDTVEIVAGVDADPVLEVSGDPRRLKSIIEGQKDARAQFFAGGISVRGDMHYLSELGMTLGFLKTPLV
jgi:predicted lipid carrier protein YhbT